MPLHILCDHARGAALSADAQRLLRGPAPFIGRSIMEENPIGTFTCPACLYVITVPGPTRV